MVLWIAGRSPLVVAGLDDGVSHARHAAGAGDSHWRRRGHDPLVPLSAAGFFLVLIGFLLVGSTVTAVQERKYSGEKVVVAGEVLRYDDGPGGFGKRHLVTRYPVGDELLTGEMLADDLDLDQDVPRPGQQVASPGASWAGECPVFGVWYGGISRLGPGSGTIRS